MEQLIQLVGALLVLLGYLFTQTGRLDGAARSYLIINLVGSALLALVAALGQQWGFLLLNGVWSLISLVNLARVLRSDGSPRGNAATGR